MVSNPERALPTVDGALVLGAIKVNSMSSTAGRRALLGGLAMLAMAGAAAQQTVAKPDLPRPQMQDLARVYELLLQDGATPMDGAALIVAAIRGMVKGADPDAGEYFGEEDFARFRAPRVAATGVEVQLRNGQFVLTPMHGGPAREAGVRSGDQLYAVDGTRTAGMDVQDVFQRLAGPAGSRVTLTVFRESTLTVMRIPVERRLFEVPRPRVSRPTPDLAMLQLAMFDASTLADAVGALRAAWLGDPFKGLILDLRGCPGGLLDAAIGVAAMFLPPNTLIAEASGRPDGARTSFRATKADYLRSGEDPLARLPQSLRELPLALLVDGGTAAGAEMVAAALRDHQRARIFGQRSFGRASLQKVRPLGKSSGIRYTYAYWTSPSGQPIHRVGVVPDMLVADDEPAAALQAAIADLSLR